MKAVRFIFLFLFSLLTTAYTFGAQTEPQQNAKREGSAPDNATRRFGIFIGSNNGGRERVMLRYAVTDARSMINVFSEMGGITGNDAILLAEPTIREINNRIDAVHRQVLNAKGTNRRTEVFFYYSGHSDEEGLLLNREKYSYRDLRDKINSIPSDMKIVILDSCASGAFTRLKGGEKTVPFLVDSSFTAEGYAFLTSSSANEASQESDRIAASYFTHSLVAGLRGAADSVGDGRVTLNELYRYAYADTLARTETSMHGRQHPSYDIQISGTGDLVLTDVNQTSASIAFDENLTGRLSIRNSNDHLIVELTKTVRPLELGLEPGFYSITLQQGSDLLRAEVTLTEGGRTVVTRNNFVRIGTEPARRRGDDISDSALFTGMLPPATLYTFFVNVAYEPFPFPLVGFINFGIGSHKLFQAGFINLNTENFDGLQASFINTTGGNFNGLQAGFVNTTRGDFSGLQASFINTSVGETKGIQAAFVNIAVKEMTGPQFGFVNIAAQNINGVQIGFVNYADSIKGIPIGFLSIVRNGGYQAIEYHFSEFFTYNIGIKTGVEKFYTSFNLAYNQTDEATLDNLATGFGMGSILPIGNIFYFNPELLSYSTWMESTLSYNSFIPYFGFNLGKFSIAAGPSVTWVIDIERLNNMYRHSNSRTSTSEQPALPKPLFSLQTFDINEYNMVVIGARVAARIRF